MKKEKQKRLMEEREDQLTWSKAPVGGMLEPPVSSEEKDRFILDFFGINKPTKNI